MKRRRDEAPATRAHLLSCPPVLIKVLYVILVLSFVALVWVALASYIRVRRQLKQPRPDEREEIPKQPEE